MGKKNLKCPPIFGYDPPELVSVHGWLKHGFGNTKSVLGRVRNNIHEVYVACELRHYRLYVKWVLYKLHVSVARAGDGS